MSDSMREAFEGQFSAVPERSGDGYVDGFVNNAFRDFKDGWQSALEHAGRGEPSAYESMVTRQQAIKIIERITDHDDPYWENVVEDYGDEENDTWPSIYDVLAALGVSSHEYKEATGAENVDWPPEVPKPPAPAVPESGQGWYCAHCQRGVDPTEVTFNETHTECGRVITDDDPPKSAFHDVLAERHRQVTAEGWTPEHDDQYQRGELASATMCYAYVSTQYEKRIKVVTDIFRQWPWPPEWWKPTTRRRDLVKAGALILAEIERLDRSEPDE